MLFSSPTKAVRVGTLSNHAWLNDMQSQVSTHPDLNCSLTPTGQADIILVGAII